MRVGVIGLGDIGQGLATHISKAGLELAVFDVRPEATEAFADQARVCADLAEVGAAADALFVAVVTDDQVRAVLDPVSGALASLGPGAIIVIVSTVGIDTVREMAELAVGRGVGLVDCGVSGGPAAAASGTLVSMVGGEDADVERVRPVIDAFSSLVVRMGPVGAGQRAKLARNVVQYGSWLAAHEGARLAEAAGIELAKLAEVIRESDKLIGGSSRLLYRATTAPFGPDDPAMIVDAMRAGATLAHKDLQAALGLGTELGLTLPLVDQAEARMDEVFGLGDSGGVA
jgi:3-hydroxyisobutyrate dehydrogenase